jgi:hypothetical protein
MSFDTLANIKTRLGISTTMDDAVLTLLQNSSERWISNYCGRDFGGGTYTEYHPGGTEFLHLRNFPVQSVTSVNVDPGYVFGAGTIVSATAYVVHLERGVVQSLVGPFAPHVDRQGLVNRHVHNWTQGPRVVQVVYTVAAGPIADDILEANAQLIGHWYRRCKTQSGLGFVNVSTQKVGEFQSSYRPQQVAGLPVPPDVYALLAPYRVPSV